MVVPCGFIGNIPGFLGSEVLNLSYQTKLLQYYVVVFCFCFFCFVFFFCCCCFFLLFFFCFVFVLFWVVVFLFCFVFFFCFFCFCLFFFFWGGGVGGVVQLVVIPGKDPQRTCGVLVHSYTIVLFRVQHNAHGLQLK